MSVSVQLSCLALRLIGNGASLGPGSVYFTFLFSWYHMSVITWPNQLQLKFYSMSVFFTCFSAFFLLLPLFNNDFFQIINRLSIKMPEFSDSCKLSSIKWFIVVRSEEKNFFIVGCTHRFKTLDGLIRAQSLTRQRLRKCEPTTTSKKNAVENHVDFHRCFGVASKPKNMNWNFLNSFIFHGLWYMSLTD